MEKKGKKRWFILCGNTLYWFTSEPVRVSRRGARACVRVRARGRARDADCARRGTLRNATASHESRGGVEEKVQK